MKFIQLTQGARAAVDDKDFEYLNNFKWHLWDCHGYKYAKRSVYVPGHTRSCPNRTKTIRMHHDILPRKKGFLIDHKDGNGLNNRRSNIRYATSTQNSMNRKPHKNNTSGARGIYIRPEGWIAMIRKNNKLRYIGSFRLKRDAVAARKEAERSMFGEFASNR